MRNTQRLGWIGMAVVAAAAAGMTACGQGESTDTQASMSEMATATVSGSVNSSKDGQVAMRASSRRKTLLAGLSELASPVGTAWAGLASCPTVLTGVDGQNCSVDSTGKAMTLKYASCDFGNRSAVWDGAAILTSSDPVTCGSLPSEAAGATLLRTFAPGTTRTIANSVHVTTLDTSTSSGFQTAVSGGTLITFKSDESRTIDIKGVHVLSQKVFRGTGNEGRVDVEADHTVSTSAEHPIQVEANGDIRTVNGTVVVQHNLAKYVGTAEFKDVTYVKGCCHPQSGTVTTTLSGSKKGTETIEFQTTDCGSAKVKGEKGDWTNLTLTRCF